MTKIKTDAKYTKSGYSKAGISCCGHWTFCDMGKKECFHSKTDPEVKEYCSCYKREHQSAKIAKAIETKGSSNEINKDEEKNFLEKFNKVDGETVDRIIHQQISLFDFE